MNNEDNPSEFDMDKAAAELRAAGPPRRSGRKLSLEGQCAAFAALRNGAKFHAVASVFNLSETSVSNLAGCIFDDRPPVEDGDGGFHDLNLTRKRNPERKHRYLSVATEFDRLGELEFKRRYYTPDIHARVMQAQSKPKSNNRYTPNPEAREFSGIHDFGEGLWIRVEWVPDLGGWLWIECYENGDIGANKWKGRDKSLAPYRTSKEAYDGADKYWKRD